MSRIEREPQPSTCINTIPFYCKKMKNILKYFKSLLFLKMLCTMRSEKKKNDMECAMCAKMAVVLWRIGYGNGTWQTHTTNQLIQSICIYIYL